ncbi:MAG: transcription termination/antitermination factor NusG [Candidatus Omnitrophica bacterium]|nr:transcription termination/antitermination factor NusG [Candidatus Omnitrophota bacterium]
MSEMKWYAVHTYAGFENRVKESLDNAVRRDRLEDRIGQVIIPTEEFAEIKDGKKRISTRKIMPGYVLLEMILDEQTWGLVKETPGVSGFVGPAKAPTPLTEEEMKNILGMMEVSGEAPRPKITFEKGDRVKVIDGPFLNFAGTVSSINVERGRLTVMIEMLGRATPVELDFLQVERTAA